MPSLQEIQNEISPVCQRVERFRQEQYAKYKKGLVFLLIPVAIVIIMVIWMVASEGDGISVPAGLIGIVLSLVMAYIFYVAGVNKHQKAYRDQFKSQVFKAFVEMLYPGMDYDAMRGIHRSEFINAEMFKNPDRFTAEDYFSGQIGGTKVEFSEVKAEDTRTTRNSSGKRAREHVSTIFRGLFFIIDSPRPVYSNVLVLPDTAENLMGGVGRWIQRSIGSLYQGKKMVYFEEYPEFEKQFVVYSNEEEEARNLLTPTLLRTICDLRNKWHTHIHLAFKGNKIYLALPMPKDLFETSFNRSLTESGVLRDLYQELALCFVAIEDFAKNSTE